MKRLVLCLVLFTAAFSALNAATFHAILVVDTLDDSIGETVEIDITRFRDFADEICDTTGMKLDWKIFRDKALIEEDIMAYLNTGLKVAADDLVWFYYSGHGFRDASTATDWTVMSLEDRRGRSKGLDQHVVTTILRKKNPRLLINFADACNNVIDWEIPYQRRALASPKSMKTAYASLFLSFKGEILASGCVPGETSGCNTDLGGFFSAQFFDALKRAVSGGSADWYWLMRETSRPINDGEQNPQYKVTSGRLGTDAVAYSWARPQSGSSSSSGSGTSSSTSAADDDDDIDYSDMVSQTDTTLGYSGDDDYEDYEDSDYEDYGDYEDYEDSDYEDYEDSDYEDYEDYGYDDSDYDYGDDDSAYSYDDYEEYFDSIKACVDYWGAVAGAISSSGKLGSSDLASLTAYLGELKDASSSDEEGEYWDLILAMAKGKKWKDLGATAAELRDFYQDFLDDADYY